VIDDVYEETCLITRAEFDGVLGAGELLGALVVFVRTKVCVSGSTFAPRSTTPNAWVLAPTSADCGAGAAVEVEARTASAIEMRKARASKDSKAIIRGDAMRGSRTFISCPARRVHASPQ
jgi:hypothetical protein